MSGKARDALRTLALWATAFVVWEGVVRVFAVPDYVMPAPSEIASALASSLDYLAENAWVTIQEVLLALLLCTVIAIPGAALVTKAPVLRRFILPVIVGGQAAPKEALAPLLVLWFGFNMFPRVLLGAMIAIFPLFLNAVVGLERFSREMGYLARSMGAGPLRTFVSFRLRVALPAILSGYRVAVAFAFVGAVLGEFIGSDVGIGRVVLAASRNVDLPLLFAGLVLVVVASWLLTGLVRWFELRFVPTQRVTGMGRAA